MRLKKLRKIFASEDAGRESGRAWGRAKGAVLQSYIVTRLHGYKGALVVAERIL
jgi:hypothetical protein